MTLSSMHVPYLHIPDAHSSIHTSCTELATLVTSSIQHWDLAEIFGVTFPHMRANKWDGKKIKLCLTEKMMKVQHQEWSCTCKVQISGFKFRSCWGYSNVPCCKLHCIKTTGSAVHTQNMFCLLPDAVLVKGVQFFVGALGLWGPTVQVLETFSSTNTFLGCLFGNIQLSTKCQAAFGTVVYKQHRVTVMALQKQQHERLCVNMRLDVSCDIHSYHYCYGYALKNKKQQILLFKAFYIQLFVMKCSSYSK